MPGVLILVVGPSGVGKDTLLDGARQTLDRARFVFPRRVITRAEDAGGEDHQGTTPEAFARQRADGAFALSWPAHGHDYGVPASIVDDLTAGHHVVVNVSRGVIDDARQRFPRVGVVSISAPRDALKSRLEERGRETREDVESRLDRAAAVTVAGDDVIDVVNDGSVEQGIARFIAALETLAAD
ncbi:MAG: phosphonate metabolism protein/1,5-bisphosphokinase (PRPP-forming) PhnN [Pseudomonadota bacterium]